MKKAALAGAAEGGTTTMNYPNTNEPAWQRLAETLPVTTPEGRTELANARRFAAVHKDRARFCPGLGWLAWDGRRWARSDAGVEHLAKAIADWVWSQGDGEEIKRFAARTASSGGIRGMVRLAKTEPELAVDADALNSDPLLLNVANGTLDLRTTTLREHRPEDLITQLCLTPYEPSVKSRLWMKFLHDVFQAHTELVDYANRLLGYCLTGSVKEQTLPILFGDGANGKSTLINAVIEVLGKDYAMQAVPEMILETSQTRHRTERFDLLRKRLVSASETGQGARLNEAWVKQLTGGERIRANEMYCNNVEFRPTHKIILNTNALPRIRGTDHGIWRRLQCVPFRRRFDGDERDGALPDKLRSEAVGILSCLVDGCLCWQERGLDAPDAVKAESKAYHLNENALERFVHDCCIVQQNVRVRFSDFYRRLSGFCDSDRSTVPTPKEAGAWLKERFSEKKSNGMWYEGIALKAGDDGA